MNNSTQPNNFANVSIDNDVFFSERLKNPQITRLKKVLESTKSTHFNSWISTQNAQIFNNTYTNTNTSNNLPKTVFELESNIFQHVHFISDFSIQIVIGSDNLDNLDNPDVLNNLNNFENIIKNITLEFEHKNKHILKLLDLDGLELDKILSLLNFQYIKKLDNIKSDNIKSDNIKSEKKNYYRIDIPLQYLIFGNSRLFLQSFNTIKIVVKFDQDFTIYKSVFNARFIISEKEEYNRNLHSVSQYNINKFFTLTTNISKGFNEINLDYNLSIKGIVVNTIESEISNLTLNSMEFYKPDNMYSDGLEKIMNLSSENKLSLPVNSKYYYMDTNTLDDNYFTNIDIYSKIIPNNKKIQFESNSDSGMIQILYIFTNELWIDPKNMIFAKCFNKFISSPISYPLTKISDNKFIEGYWQTKSECLCCNGIKYPFPKSSDIKVDADFLYKLDTILAESDLVKKNEYFGSSECRLCKNSNGCTEYTIKHNNMQFTFPSGLIHYYMIHNVQPSDEFKLFIENIYNDGI